MTTSATSNISNTLMVLLNELKDECQRYTKLVNQIELEHLSEDQIAEIMGELTVSITHLKTQSEVIKEEVER